MGQTLSEIADTLRGADKKVQLIYAFNASGKTRLSGVKLLLDHLRNNYSYWQEDAPNA